MAHPFHHSVSSARKWGGVPEDYQAIHDWFDATKALLADFRHRALRHHAEGIFLCEQVFGVTVTNSAGKPIPVRWIGEQHVMEDLGMIPSAADWLTRIAAEPWMSRSRKLSRELEREDDSERCSRCNSPGEEFFTFPAPGTPGHLSGDPDGSYCEGCYIDLRQEAGA